MSEILWVPSNKRIKSANLFSFINWLAERTGKTFNNYDSLHKWSVDNIDKFWEYFIEYSGLLYSSPYSRVIDSYKMPGAEWFEGMKLNFPQNIFEKEFSGTAIKYIPEGNVRDISNGYKTEYSFAELKSIVARVANSLLELGIKKGDRVSGYTSNVPEAIIACLACAVIGAVWSSASPDFGFEALYDRFSQVRPRILFATYEYKYNGKISGNIEIIKKLKNNIDSLEHVIFLPSPHGSLYPHTETSWDEFLAMSDSDELSYIQLPFNHPLYIMFSSGTTGTPKCIVHGAGGTLIQHRKEHLFHCDLKPGDKLMYYTTTGWMMWNWQLTALASGVTICLFDGSPAFPKITSFWDKAGEHKITHLGTSGRYIESCMKSSKDKIINHTALKNLRTILYTGSPLSSAGFEWIYTSIKTDVLLSGISGGTDIISCFVLGNPMLPVEAGKIQCKGLAVDVAAFDSSGNEIIGSPGELVCRKPLPSMPLYFLNDEGNKKYTGAYFNEFENVWTHGDYIEFDKNGQSIIYGRSDATLNPGGVRIGSAEIYSALDSLEYINGAIAAGWAPPGQSDELIILFVVLNNSIELTNEKIAEIKSVIKIKRSGRHVPKYIFKISELPVTRSGKPVELTVKAILARKENKNKAALANPEALKEIESITRYLDKLQN
jgi:acetoacetyl-CoA synthetase